MSTTKLALLAALVPSIAIAGSNGSWTVGDAERLLNTYPPGKLWEQEDWTGLDIRPFPDYDGATYYAHDPHVIAYRDARVSFSHLDSACSQCLSILSFGFVQPMNSLEELRTAVEALSPLFFLDGEPITLERSPIKPLGPWLWESDPSQNANWFVNLVLDQCKNTYQYCAPDVEIDQAFGVQWGMITPPCYFSPGAHNFTLIYPYWMTESNFTVTDLQGSICR